MKIPSNANKEKNQAKIQVKNRKIKIDGRF